MMNPNAQFSEISKVVLGLASIVPSTSVPQYVSLKGYIKLTVIILVKNATTVTGSAITLKQATTIAGAGEKALPFTLAEANIDCGATDTLVDQAVASNTFTTDATNSKNLMYVIDVDPATLDTANNFACVRVGTGDGTAATVTVLYVLWPAKAGKDTPMSAILD